MKTGFTQAQLADPKIEAANAILRNCVHCGFCAPACPTYRLTGDELEGPRGRIWLIRDLLGGGGQAPGQGEGGADAAVVKHFDHCLGCLACMPACPSGVDYRGLIGIAREVAEAQIERPFADRLARKLLGWILPDPRWFKTLVRLAWPIAWLHGAFSGRIGAALALARGARVRRPWGAAQGTYPPKGTSKGRVAMITGCAQSVLAPDINGALIRILNRAGIEAVVLDGAACCGALNEHLGQGDATRMHARKVVDAIVKEADSAGLDAVISTASGCGTLMKAYGELLAGDDQWQGPAGRAAGLVRDAGEFLDGIDMDFPPLGAKHRIAWQAPCSLANGQGGAGYGARLLARAGFDVAEPPEGPVCCGSAGTYNLMEPETASRLGVEKSRSLDLLNADAVASSNLGCMMQLAPTIAVPAVHLVELIDWSQGGPLPRVLRGRTGNW
jgi:glycolate oxidase iron-sulfur subunit